MQPFTDEFVSKKSEITICSKLHDYDVKKAGIYLNSIGTCERLCIRTKSNVEELADYYIVWYTINNKGENGFDKQESHNYTVRGFTNDSACA
jgi:hypothetical protein